MQFTISERSIESKWILAIGGRVDSFVAQHFEEELARHTAPIQGSLIFDLSGLDFISTAGLWAIIKTTKDRQKSGWGVTMCNPKGHVRELFEIAGFTKVFPIFNTLEEAIDQS